MAAGEVVGSSLMFLRNIFSERVACVMRKAVKVDQENETVRSSGACMVVCKASGGKSGKSGTIVQVAGGSIYTWAQVGRYSAN